MVADGADPGVVAGVSLLAAPACQAVCGAAAAARAPAAPGRGAGVVTRQQPAVTSPHTVTRACHVTCVTQV